MACTTQNIDLVDILNRAANMNAPLAFPEMPCSSSIMAPMVFPASKVLPRKAGGKTASKAGPAKKRTWKKPKDKPKRPLSAYNIFFKEERQRLVSTGGTGAKTGAEATTTTTIVGPDKKRRHRKSHGKIGFAALAQNIAAKWKNLDEDARCPFEAKASVEKTRYRKEIDEWNRVQKIKKEQEKNMPTPPRQAQVQVGSAPEPSPPAAATAVPPPPPSATATPSSAGGNDQATPVPSSMQKAPLDHQQPLAGPGMFASGMMNFEPISLKSLHASNDINSLRGIMAATARGAPPQQPMGPDANAHNGSAPAALPLMIFPPRQHFSLDDPVVVPPHPYPAPPPLNDDGQEKAWCNLESLDELDANIDSLLSDSAFADVSHQMIPEPAEQPHAQNGVQQPHQMPLFPSDAKTQGILSSIDKLDSELDAEFVDFLSEF